MSEREFEFLSKRISELREDIRELRQEVGDQGESLASLKTQAGIWGGISGLVAALSSLLTGNIFGVHK